jgi:hypothetical protein
MDHHRYRVLLDDMCDHVKLQHREHFLDSGLLRISDTDLLLFHDAAFDPDYLQIRIDFGAIPEDSRLDIWHGLLAANFEWGQGGYLVFSLVPANGHIILSLKHVLTVEMNGAELAGWLQFAVQEASSHWTRILSGTPVPQAAASQWQARA